MYRSWLYLAAIYNAVYFSKQLYFQTNVIHRAALALHPHHSFTQLFLVATFIVYAVAPRKV